MLVRSCPGAGRTLENEYVYTYSDTNVRFTGLDMTMQMHANALDACVFGTCISKTYGAATISMLL